MVANGCCGGRRGPWLGHDSHARTVKRELAAHWLVASHQIEIPRDHDPRPKHARKVSFSQCPSRPENEDMENGKDVGRAHFYPLSALHTSNTLLLTLLPRQRALKFSNCKF